MCHTDHRPHLHHLQHLQGILTTWLAPASFYLTLRLKSVCLGWLKAGHQGSHPGSRNPREGGREEGAPEQNSKTLRPERPTQAQGQVVQQTGRLAHHRASENQMPPTKGFKTRGLGEVIEGGVEWIAEGREEGEVLTSHLHVSPRPTMRAQRGGYHGPDRASADAVWTALLRRLL